MFFPPQVRGLIREVAHGIGRDPRALLQRGQSVRSGPAPPPSMTGIRWSAVRSLVLPHCSQRGLAQAGLTSRLDALEAELEATRKERAGDV